MSSVERMPTGRAPATTSRCVSWCSTISCAARWSGSLDLDGDDLGARQRARVGRVDAGQCGRDEVERGDDPPGEVLAAVGEVSVPLTTTAWTWLVAIVRATVVRSVSGPQLMMPGRMTSSTRACSSAGARSLPRGGER